MPEKIIIFLILDCLNFITFGHHNVRKVLDLFYFISLYFIKDLLTINKYLILGLAIFYLIVNFINFIIYKITENNQELLTKNSSLTNTNNMLFYENERLKNLLDIDAVLWYNLSEEIKDLIILINTSKDKINLTKEQKMLISTSIDVANRLAPVNKRFIDGHTFTDMSVKELKLLKKELQKISNHFNIENGFHLIVNSLIGEINSYINQSKHKKK